MWAFTATLAAARWMRRLMRFSEMTAQRSWKRFSETLKKVSGKRQRLWRCTGKGDILSRERISLLDPQENARGGPLDPRHWQFAA